MTFRNPTLVYWHGWNLLALGLLIASTLAATCAWFLLSLAFGDTLVSQMLAFCVGGLAFAVGDLFYRAKNGEFGAVWRFLSPYAGGCILFAPCWWFGVGLFATATLYLAGIAK